MILRHDPVAAFIRQWDDVREFEEVREEFPADEYTPSDEDREVARIAAMLPDDREVIA